MPRYEYVCERCGHTFEVQAKVGDPNPPCPKEVGARDREGCPVFVLGGQGERVRVPCGGPTRKLISRSSFQLLGGGWAADGYSSSK